MICIKYPAESGVTTGGSTVDTTAYSVSEVSPQLQLREVKPSACVQAGGIFVNKAAEEYYDVLPAICEANGGFSEGAKGWHQLRAYSPGWRLGRECVSQRDTEEGFWGGRL